MAVVELARREASEALREAREATRNVGALAREQSTTAGKVDQLITDVRKANGTLHMLVESVRDLRKAYAGRGKLDSFADLDVEALSQLTEREKRQARMRHTLRKWGRRMLLGALVGAATLAGATGAAYALRACHAPPVPIEVSP